MKIPFGTISISKEAKKLVLEALESSRVSCGRRVNEFEEKFAVLIGVKEAIAVSSGTDADILALAVLYDLGAKRGDEVIIPALSFVATGNAVLAAGFTPVFVDIERETLNIDPQKIEKAITSKTKAIMPVHLMGKPAPMDEICQIAKAHNLLVVEDAAEAHGAELNGKKVGSIGDLGAFSTYVAHVLSTIEGGMITAKREDFAQILRSLRSHGRACKCKSCILNTNSAFCPKRFVNGEDIRFVFERIGFSSKMNELEAAVGLGNLAYYDNILQKRRKNLLSLIEKFQKFSPLLATFKEERNEKIGPHAFPIIISEKAKFSRKDLVKYLEDKEIDTRDLFSSMPTQCKGFEFLGHKLGEFPNAEHVGRNGIHIGIHQDLGEEHIEYIVKTFENFLS